MVTEKTVLLIEDEVRLCELLASRLREAGYRVLAAHDGEWGLKRAREDRPDLIVLDLMLPKLSGEEVLEAVRVDGDKELAKTPVLVLTAKATEADRIVCKVIGADGYIRKPFQTDHLLAEIARLA